MNQAQAGYGAGQAASPARDKPMSMVDQLGRLEELNQRFANLVNKARLLSDRLSGGRPSPINSTAPATPPPPAGVLAIRANSDLNVYSGQLNELEVELSMLEQALIG